MLLVACSLTFAESVSTVWPP